MSINIQVHGGSNVSELSHESRSISNDRPVLINRDPCSDSHDRSVVLVHDRSQHTSTSDRPVVHDRDQHTSSYDRPVVHDRDQHTSSYDRPVVHDRDQHTSSYDRPVVHDRDQHTSSYDRPVVHDRDQHTSTYDRPVLSQEPDNSRGQVLFVKDTRSNGHGQSVSILMPNAFQETIPDANTFQQKKNLAQGMMDLALLSANANQLRYVLESSSTHQYYYFNLVCIIISIILQVAVGLGLIMNSRYNVYHNSEMWMANKINNLTTTAIFLVVIINVLITTFSIASPDGSKHSLHRVPVHSVSENRKKPQYIASYTTAPVLWTFNGIISWTKRLRTNECNYYRQPDHPDCNQKSKQEQDISQNQPT